MKPKLSLEEQIKAKVDKMAQWLKELAKHAWIPGLILRSQIKVEGESRLKTSHNAMEYTPTYTPWMHTWTIKVYFKIKFKKYNKDKINYFGIKMKVSKKGQCHNAKGKQTIRMSSTEQKGILQQKNKEHSLFN